ncbi:hypothetical protein AB0J38_25965 [Streptomyces sp. NPDC050095]
MTWLDVLLYGPGWLACALIPVNWYVEHRLRRVGISGVSKPSS